MHVILNIPMLLMKPELHCNVCNNTIEGYIYDLHTHIAECGHQCGGCDGFGLIEYIEAAHDTSCDGTCKDCPIPISAVEQCGRCGGSGKVDPS